MKDYDIIIRPHITEKTTAETAAGKYSFIVDRRATKIDVKKAVENLFNVKVLSVNTINYDGKKKTRRQNSGAVVGHTAAYKKAIVTIDTDPKDVTYLGEGGKTVKSAKKYKGSIEEFGVQ
ncbi:MAG: 50S ribosomal protein L23 [Clostridia bacterium]|nr:50S ribosomal protein L23 [Clostridia bacterium]